MANKKTLLWERQEGESVQAFEAFRLYRDMGVNGDITGAKRVLQKVADELQKSYTLIRRWREAWNWEERVRAYDNYIDEQARKAAEHEKKKMLRRHASMAMQLQAKALEALTKLDPDLMSPKDIKEYIRTAVEIERLTRETDYSEGEVTDGGNGLEITITPIKEATVNED